MAPPNEMSLKEVTTSTPFVVHRWERSRSYYASGDGMKFVPARAGVYALKMCGCEGPYLGRIETVKLPQREENTPKFRPLDLGYELRQETKERVGLYLNGERLFGRNFSPKVTEAQLKRLAYQHYTNMERQNRPRKPDGAMHRTAKEAMKYIPRTSCKLWAVIPEAPYRHDRIPKPKFFVWGQDAAAEALRNYQAVRNIQSRRRKMAA